MSAPSPMTATVCRPRLAAQPPGLGDAVGPGQGGGGVGVLDHVVLGLGPARVARQAALLLELAEVVPAGEQLVDVGLVAGVEDDGVPGAVEDAVQRDGQLDDAEVGAEVAAGLGDRLDEEVPDLLGQPGSWAGVSALRSAGPVMVSSTPTHAVLSGSSSSLQGNRPSLCAPADPDLLRAPR